MSGFDRSKFKGSSIAALKETRKAAEKKSSTFGGGRPGFHKTEEGMNVFRIAPAHNPDDPSYRPLRTAWLTCEVPKLDDDGEETGKTEEAKRRIYIATIHGKDIKEDPIETYIKYVFAKASDEIDDKDERSKYLAPITGWRGKDKKWNPGIRPSTNYVFYAWKDDELGRIEFYTQILKKMEELNIDEESDEMIDTDCFSDPDDGVHLLIKFDKGAKAGERYQVKKREFKPSKHKTYEAFMEGERITDEQLQELSSKESLKDIYTNVYSKKDFDLALNGLAIFDEANGYNIFENEEFIADLNEIESQVPEKTDKQTVIDGDDIDKNFNKNSKKTDTTADTGGAEDISKWSKPKCRKFLEAYILDNYGNDEVLPELDLTEIREWAALASADEDLPFDSGDDSSEQTDEIEASDTSYSKNA
jgi:hypothetical protein